MKRLLCIVGIMDAGGAETFLMKLYRQLDKSKYQMDFCVSDKKKGIYEDEILSMGGKIYRINNKSDNLLSFIRDLKNVIKDGHYDRVLRIGADCFCAIDLWIAFFCGVKIRAFRSSNSGSIQKNLVVKLHKILRTPLMLVANVKFAPSDLAAEFTFGKRCLKKNKIIFLHNAINTNLYKYDEDNKNKIRKELELENNFVIGHIGRFNVQKNHDFLLQICAEVMKTNPNIRLLLVGKGELKNQILQQIEHLKISDKVILTGIRNDIPELLSAIDLIVFPSFFEGMPNVIIEAQAAGLKCLISSEITKEVNITNLVTFLPLSDKNKWVDEINNIVNNPYERKNYTDKFIENDYCINQITDVFVDKIFK